MSFTDLLTISMPVYERKDFFREALDSALNQTVKCKVIVVDNCSSHDYFKQVCKEKEVTYYRNDRNIGMAGNFAKGFELAETKYVLNLQDDDQLSPIYVESFLKAHTEHPDIDIFFSDFVRLTEEGKKPHRHTLPFGYMENGTKVIEYGIKYKLGFPYIASAIKRTKAKDSLLKYESTGSYDWLWLYSEADQFAFYGDERPLYIFRDHDNQDTKNNSINYSLSIPYIYDRVLRDRVSGQFLKDEAEKMAFWKLIQLKSDVSKKKLEDFMNGNTIYSDYLKEKLHQDNRLRIIFAMPRMVVDLGYRSLKKIGVNSH